MRILVAIFILFARIGFCQTSSISVLGKTTYTEEAKQGCIVLSAFRSKENSVGTIQLKNELNLRKLNVEINGKIKYLFETKSEDSLQTAILKLKSSDFKIERVYYKYEPHNFRAEDNRAIESIDNALQVAGMMAEKIGYKLSDILNIDDDVQRSSNSDWFTCTNEDLMKLLEQEGFTSISVSFVPYPTESNQRFRTSEYNTWVTFEIIKSNSR